MGNFWDDVTPQSVASASDGFSEFKVGDNEAVIDLVEESRSKSGNEMIVIHFKNETGAKIRFYIVNDEYKLQKIKQLQLAFGIPLGNISPNSWIGARGVVVCKQGKPYEGKVRNEVSYLQTRQNANPAQNQSGQRREEQRPPMESGYMTPGQSGYNNPPDDHFNDDIPF